MCNNEKSSTPAWIESIEQALHDPEAWARMTCAQLGIMGCVTTTIDKSDLLKRNRPCSSKIA